MTRIELLANGTYQVITEQDIRYYDAFEVIPEPLRWKLAVLQASDRFITLPGIGMHVNSNVYLIYDSPDDDNINAMIRFVGKIKRLTEKYDDLQPPPKPV